MKIVEIIHVFINHFNHTRITQHAEDSLTMDLANAQLWFFAKGSFAPRYVYFDEECNIARQFPLVADTQGEFGPVFLKEQPEGDYTMKLRHADGRLLLSLNTGEDEG